MDIHSLGASSPDQLWNPELDKFYGTEYHHMERRPNINKGKFCEYQLSQTPVCRGTVTGEIIYEGEKIQTFHVDSHGSFHFSTRTCRPNVVWGELNLLTGLIRMEWTDEIAQGQTELVTCFECPRDNSTPCTDVLCLLLGNANHMLVTNRDLEAFQANWVSLDVFSPTRQAGDHLFFYRVLCYDVDKRLNSLAQLAQRFFAVDAWFEMYEVAVVGGFTAPSMKLLFSNDPRKLKPPFINHANEIPDRCSATDS